MRISLCQFDIYWNAPEANFATIEELCSGLNTDLLVLPEMFSSGFAPTPHELADPMAIKSTRWMQAYSSDKALVGSVAKKENDKYYNTALFCHQNKVVSSYNKRHVYLGTESEHYSKGSDLGSVNYNDWNIGLNICYDLRFPVWSRAQKADLLIYSANWPDTRKEHWFALLKARAIENQCYVVGVNRIGKDNNGWSFEGGSVVFDYWGNEIINLQQEEGVETVLLDLEAQNDYRQKLTFLNDRDNFSLDV